LFNKAVRAAAPAAADVSVTSPIAMAVPLVFRTVTVLALTLTTTVSLVATYKTLAKRSLASSQVEAPAAHATQF